MMVSLIIAEIDTDVTGITFNNDGTEMYLVGQQTDLQYGNVDANIQF